MKTAHLVVGIFLIILAVLLWISATFLGGGACMDDPALARLFGVPSCGQIVNQIFAVGAGGVLFLIIGIVVLVTGREKESS